MDVWAEDGLMDDPQSDARAVPVSPAGYACGPVPNGVAMLEAEIVRLRGRYISSDEYGYPEPTAGASRQTQTDPALLLPLGMVPNRVAALEAEIVRLRALLDCIKPLSDRN